MNAVYRNKSGDEVRFDRHTLKTELPEDDSRNAVVLPKEGEALADVRQDALSIQYQVNQFLTSRMTREPKRTKSEE